MTRDPSTPRSCAYLDALSQEIEKKLQRALDSPTQRRELLQVLFADIALEVDDKAKEIIFGREDDAIAPADDDHCGQLCFYDVLADYYVWTPDKRKPILSMIVQLWSQSFASHIFSLLFHKWLFEAQVEDDAALLRYSSALIQGATNVFWIDIQTKSRRYQNLFCYLLRDVALNPAQLNKIPVQAQRELYLLLSRFMFFYNEVDKLERFLKHCPVFSNAFLVGSSSDIFVTELSDQNHGTIYFSTHKMSDSEAEGGACAYPLPFTTQCPPGHGTPNGIKHSTESLFIFTSPGGPMYPTRAVRHAAWNALDLLFPVGRYPRHLISLFFRLLYPWYWPSSCWNFVVCCVAAIFYSVLGYVLSCCKKLRKPKLT